MAEAPVLETLNRRRRHRGCHRGHAAYVESVGFLGGRYMQPALEKASSRKFRFHDLRHTFGSLLIQDGASLTYVKEQMGYSSIQITVDTYGHLIPGADIAWVDRLDAKVSHQQNTTPAQPEQNSLGGGVSEVVDSNWLPPRDSNPDMLIQSQLSCR